MIRGLSEEMEERWEGWKEWEILVLLKSYKLWLYDEFLWNSHCWFIGPLYNIKPVYCRVGVIGASKLVVISAIYQILPVFCPLGMW